MFGIFFERSNAVFTYYDLQDILEHASERREEFSDIDPRIARAVTEGMKKFQKYYTFMDASDTYYTALILDPRVQGDLLIDELEDEDAAREILQTLRLNIHRNYPVDSQTPSLPVQSTQHGSRTFRKLKPLAVEAKSDVDRNFDSPRMGVDTDHGRSELVIPVV
ncbi:hypothetical protein V1508DRAFT_399702 [Lipomyces doorenjongii]|uniref:uncharacterized protein n=1 Tax=Lipomyces doorenjongii TaxID=383834 RepID=UPI0034CF89E2